MRKLAYFVLMVLAIVSTWAVAAWLSPAVKSGSEGLFKAILGTGWTLISGAWTNLLTIVSANGTNFLIYTLGVLIFAGFFWIGMAKLWAKRPKIFGRVEQGVSSAGSSLASATGIRSTTPAGATTRPAAVTSSVSTEPNPSTTVTATVEPTEEETKEA